MAATGEEISPIVSRSVGDNHKPIIGPNRVDRVEMKWEIDGEGGASLESHRFRFSNLGFRTILMYIYIYIYVLYIFIK